MMCRNSQPCNGTYIPPHVQACARCQHDWSHFCWQCMLMRTTCCSIFIVKPQQSGMYDFAKQSIQTHLPPMVAQCLSSSQCVLYSDSDVSDAASGPTTPTAASEVPAVHTNALYQMPDMSTDNASSASGSAVSRQGSFDAMRRMPEPPVMPEPPKMPAFPRTFSQKMAEE